MLMLDILCGFIHIWLGVAWFNTKWFPSEDNFTDTEVPILQPEEAPKPPDSE
jgi:hypothetical protein